MYKKRIFKIRKIWRYRYRFYAAVVLFLTLFLFRSNSPEAVAVVIPRETLAYDIVEEKVFAKRVVPAEDPENSPVDKIVLRDKSNSGEKNRVYYDEKGKIVTDQERTVLYENMGYVLSEPILDLSTKLVVDTSTEREKTITLNDIIPVPSNPEKEGWIKYERFGINAPIVFATDKHLFNTDKNGNIDYTSPIIEDPNAVRRGDYTSTPVLKLLLDGAVHLGGAVSPQPGEYGNAYIVGHSANYSSVVSPYNYIFTKLIDRSDVGDTFYIYDQFGRKLKFRVFEAQLIRYDEAAVAYATERFKDRRVVTLQTCKSEWVSGRGWIPNYRWLTRGELIDEDGNIIK